MYTSIIIAGGARKLSAVTGLLVPLVRVSYSVTRRRIHSTSTLSPRRTHHVLYLIQGVTATQTLSSLCMAPVITCRRASHDLCVMMNGKTTHVFPLGHGMKKSDGLVLGF